MGTVTLLENFRLWLDFESHSVTGSGRWQVEGTYTEISDTRMQCKVKYQNSGGGPLVNSVLSFDMDIKAKTLTFDGQKCAFQPGIPGVDVEKVSQAKAAVAAGETLTLTQLQDKSLCTAKGVDAASRENYLSDAEFLSVFGMTKVEFTAMPAWKKQEAKKRHGIF